LTEFTLGETYPSAEHMWHLFKVKWPVKVTWYDGKCLLIYTIGEWAANPMAMSECWW